MLLPWKTAFNRDVLMIDSADHVTGKTGLTLTITAGKDGGALGAITPTVTERTVGWYQLALTAAHLDTRGCFKLHITGTGADPTDTLDLVTPIVVAGITEYIGSVTGATTTSTLIDSSLTQAFTDHWAGRILIFPPAASIGYMATQITGFDPATDKLTFVALPSAPAASDPYIVL